MSEETGKFQVGDMIVVGNTVAELVYYDHGSDVSRYKTADNNTHTIHTVILDRVGRLLTPELHEESAESVAEATATPELVEDRLAKARAAKAAKKAATEGVTLEAPEPVPGGVTLKVTYPAA